MGVKIKMDLKETALAHQPKRTLNVADLEVVPLTAPITNRSGTTSDGKDFEYDVVTVEGDDYRVPSSVLESIKTIVETKPEVASVKVVKKGTGMNTEYTVIPL